MSEEKTVNTLQEAVNPEETLEQQANQIARDLKANKDKISNYEFFSNYDVKPLLDSIGSGVDKYGNPKKSIKYLSWGKAWMIVKSWDSSATARAVEYDGQPYRLIGMHGDVVVETEVVINGEVGRMTLPMYDNQGNSIRIDGYTKTVKTKDSSFPVNIPGFDSMLWNKAYFRCLVKNLAFNFGLGLTVYSNMETALGLYEVSNDGELLEKEKLQPAKAKTGLASLLAKDKQVAENTSSESPEPALVKQPAATKTKSKVEVSSNNSSSVGKVEDSILADALEHVFATGGKNLVGKVMKDFVAFPQEPEQIETADYILNQFIEKGKNPDDVSACQIIRDALNNGLIQYGVSY